MNTSIPFNLAAGFPSQPLPIGQLRTAPVDVSLQNSTFRPVDPLASNEKSSNRLNSSINADVPAESVRLDENNQRSQTESENLDDARAKRQLLEDQRKIAELSARDREVRAHEQAHAAVGGQYAGAPSYTYERGPDGVRYAVGGEVPIDVGKEVTPEATIRKAQVVKRAALAPADPSSQDRRVAAQASQMEAQARAELAQERIEEARSVGRTEEGEEADTTAAASSDFGRPVINREALKGASSADETRSSTFVPVNSISSSGQALFRAVLNSEPAQRQNGDILDAMV